MDYINSIRRVQKTDLDDFFGQIKQLREKEAVSPEEEKELRKYATELKGDEKKCAVDQSSAPCSFTLAESCASATSICPASRSRTRRASRSSCAR